MREETKEVLKTYFALVGYNREEQADCLRSIEETLIATETPPEITYGTGLLSPVYSNHAGVDLLLPENGLPKEYEQAYYTLEEADTQTMKAKAEGYLAVTLVLLSLPLETKNLLLAYSTADIPSTRELAKDLFWKGDSGVTSANYH